MNNHSQLLRQYSIKFMWLLKFLCLTIIKHMQSHNIYRHPQTFSSTVRTYQNFDHFKD